MFADLFAGGWQVEASMCTWRSRMLAAAGWLFFIAMTAEAAPPSAEQLAEWLRDLDAEEFMLREEANRNLIAAGDAAIDVLAQGALSSSPEAAWRASTALEAIALAGNEATLKRVSAALVQLSQRGKPGAKLLAANLRGKQMQVRHDKAAAKIRSLGGKLTGEEESHFIGIEGFIGGVLPVLVDGAVEVGFEGIVERPIAPQPEEAIEDEPSPALGAKVQKEEVTDPDPPPALAEAGGPVPVEEPTGIGEPFVGQDLVAEVLGGEIGEVAVDVPAETLVLDAAWRGGDKGLAALAELPSIVSLSLSDAKLTDAALVHIAALPRLAQLSLEGKTGITADGLGKFRKSRPGMQIFARGEALMGVNAEMSGPCVLSSVAAGSGAFDAGLRPGDELLSVGGRKVSDFSDLTIAVFTRKAGEKLQVEYRREGKAGTAEVVLKSKQLIERVQP
jgi:hypothetical protein